MRNSITIVAGILLVSSIAAAVANTLWVKLDWIRQPLPTPTAQVRPLPDSAHPSAGHPAAIPNRKTNSVIIDHPPPQVNPKPTQPTKPGFIEKDAVLQSLTEGTAFFIDAREQNEYVEGHLRGAINMPSSSVYERIDQVTGLIGMNDRVVVYCNGGDCEASHNVADALRRDFGYSNVLIYEKGWEEIESSGQFTNFLETGAEP